MSKELETPLTALYVELEGRVLPRLGWPRVHRRGRKPARLLDSAPLPCAASRETVKRSDLAGHAGYGYCASHSRFFWGFRLYLITTAEGMPIVWGLATRTSASARRFRRCWSPTVSTIWCPPCASGPQERAGPLQQAGPRPAVDRVGD